MDMAKFHPINYDHDGEIGEDGFPNEMLIQHGSMGVWYKRMKVEVPPIKDQEGLKFGEEIES